MASSDIKQYQKEYRERNKEKRKRYLLEHREIIRMQKKEWHLKNKEKNNLSSKNWYRENKEARADYVKSKRRHFYDIHNKRRRERYANDQQFKLRVNLRNRIKKALKYKISVPKTEIIIGCSIAELKIHLESLFQPGMTWDNHTYTGWHIDHKIPCSSFDLTLSEERTKCFHYTNLQPLWGKENISKSNKVYGKL